MAVELVKQAIRVFLRTATPQVLCIRGKWGVGKTFMWDEVFKQAASEGAVALQHYCYVSLFGLQSIDEVRQTIFENRVPTSRGQVEPTLESIKKNVQHLAEVTAQKVSRISPYVKVPYFDKYLSSFTGGFRQILSLAVKDTIICFDDFERKKISTRDLLGLISQLREQRQCKAVIILNEDALSEDERGEFTRYFEKVVDIPIEFVPTPVECAQIALKGDDMPDVQIRRHVETLEISNIRIIRRVKEMSEELLQILDRFGDEVTRQALHSLTLFVWSKYDDEAIPVSFIRERSERPLASIEESEQTDDEKKWIPKLKNYDFGQCDTFDLAILKGVERGFFDETEIVSEAAQQHARHELSARHTAIFKAWQLFHSSFADNAKEVVVALHTAYKDNMLAVSRDNLDDVVILIRELGYEAEASDLVAAYMEFNKEKIAATDDSRDPFYTPVKDVDFRAALASAATPPRRKSGRESLLAISPEGYRREDEEAVLALSVDELYAIFKGSPQEELSGVVRGSLFWKRVSNATERQRELTARAVAALQRIGREAPINALRLKRYGVDLES